VPIVPTFHEPRLATSERNTTHPRHKGTGPPLSWTRSAMHYPHRISRLKRKRSIGFRARMKTTNGRKLINRKRRVGRSLNVSDK